MLRRLLGGPNAARNALFAVVPLVIGASLWLVLGDSPSSQNSRIETTQDAVDPLLPDALGPGSTDQAPATPAGQAGAGTGTAAAGLAAPAPGTGTVTEGSRSAGAGSGSAPAGSTGSGPGATGPFRDVTDGVSGGTDGVTGGTDDGAVEEEPTRATPRTESSATTVPAPEPTSTSPSTTLAPEVTTTPTTQAPEVTTTTTTTTAPVRSGRTRDAAVEAEVVPLTNDDRRAVGLGSLSRSSCLDSIASGYAEQMARSGVLAHNPGAGPAVMGCQPGATWGDNVGTAAPCDTALLEREWMASPTHSRNILDGAFRRIGVGAWTDERGGCWVQVLFSS